MFAYNILTCILGSGMSSRLFRTVREENGLCYSIHAYTAIHRDTGVSGVYLALGKDTEKQALELTRGVIERFVREGPAEEELIRAREQNKSNALMSLESTVSRSNSIGNAVLFHNAAREPDEISARYDAVTREEVQALAEEIFNFSEVSLSVVGKPDKEETYRELLG